MALLNAKLYVKRNGEAAVPCNLYSTTEEVGGEYVTVTASNTKAYAKLGGTSDAFCTQARVKKGTNTYAILSQIKPPYNKIEYRTPGTYTVTFPVGVTTAKLTLAGGGGGGGGYAVNAYAANGSGGSGGAGNLYVGVVSVIPGTYQVQVGAGGTAGKANAYGSSYDFYGGSGASGTSSTFGSYTSNGGGGGGGGSCWDSNGGSNGSKGTNAGNGLGGSGGRGGYVTTWNDDGGNHLDNTYGAVAGSPGWVIIEYGGDI